MFVLSKMYIAFLSDWKAIHFCLVVFPVDSIDNILSKDTDSIIWKGYLSNGKTITPPFGRSLLFPFSPKKYFHSPAMQGFFRQNWNQNKLVESNGLIISSLLSLKN